MDRAADAAAASELLRDSAFAADFARRPRAAFADDRALFREANFAAFAFKRIDLVAFAGRFVAFLVAFFVAFLRAFLRFAMTEYSNWNLGTGARCPVTANIGAGAAE